ncbi:MAG: hybrid sensor histidine kinase/response regulator, partial [Bacteroides sp.]|nr:hybrid sensor histidine kinase/response regulator [Bacteroides sp.]
FYTNAGSYITAVDEIKIEKVVDNLISNALKYSHPRSKVKIFLHCDPEKWSLEVKDYGLGISQQAKSKLFREFYRGDNKANARIVGSGIGLLLVKKYVTLHGGRIDFESEEHVGSSFRFTIPYRSVEEVPYRIDRPLEEVSVGPANRGITEDTSRDSSRERTSHILIVEDNTDLQDFLFHSLGERYKISRAGDGNEAWEVIGKQASDLVLSDVMMPGMDGFRLCEKIKSTFETAHIPVILLTSLSLRKPNNWKDWDWALMII